MNSASIHRIRDRIVPNVRGLGHQTEGRSHDDRSPHATALTSTNAPLRMNQSVLGDLGSPHLGTVLADLAKRERPRRLGRLERVVHAARIVIERDS